MQGLRWYHLNGSIILSRESKMIAVVRRKEGSQDTGKLPASCISCHAFPVLDHTPPTKRHKPASALRPGREKGLASTAGSHATASPSFNARTGPREPPSTRCRRMSPRGFDASASSEGSGGAHIDGPPSQRRLHCPGKSTESVLACVRRRTVGSSMLRESREAKKDSNGICSRGCGAAAGACVADVDATDGRLALLAADCDCVRARRNMR